MNKKKTRDILYLLNAVLFSFLYIPHILIYVIQGAKNSIIASDVRSMKHYLNIKLPDSIALLYFLHNNAYYRTLFYYRIGPLVAGIIGWYRPGDKHFIISSTLKLGHGCIISHPFATIINADSIGKNFWCRQCTTIGHNAKGRPTIGDNVNLGSNVIIIGKITIGNNVIVGAGSVVVKDVPDNCTVAGNPAKIIRYH